MLLFHQMILEAVVTSPCVFDVRASFVRDLHLQRLSWGSRRIAEVTVAQLPCGPLLMPRPVSREAFSCPLSPCVRGVGVFVAGGGRLVACT